MDIIDLNIPSKFAHSIFLDRDGKEINLKKGYVDIFYTLVYLGRRKLFELNNDCLLNDTIELENGKKKNGKKLKDNINYNMDLSFEFCEISSLIFEAKQQSKGKKEGKHNSRYNEIRKFIDEFKDVYVKTNIFDKDKKEGSETIKVFDKLEVSNSDNLCLDVVFAEEYISPYMITKEYFKKVRLEILYRLNSIYLKKMYLFLKDYSNCEKKTNKDNISMFLGMDYSKRKIELYLYEINKYSDIKVKLIRPKYGKKSDIKFTIKNQDYFVNDKAKYDYERKCGLNEFIMKDCRRIADIKISNGETIDDYDRYIDGIFKNKTKSEHEFLRYESMYEVKQYISYYKDSMEKELDRNEKFPMLCFRHKDENGDCISLVVDNDYKLVNFSSLAVIASDAIETAIYLNNLIINENISFEIHYHFSGKNKNWLMMYF